MSEHYSHQGRSQGGPRQYSDDPMPGAGRDHHRMYRSYDRERSFGSRSPPRFQRPPHEALPKDSKRLYINQLPQDVSEQLLRTIFSKFGNITRCDIPRYGSGNNKGYAFIIFDSQDAAKKAIERSDTITINGSHVSIEYGFEKGFQAHDGEFRPRGGRGGRYFPRGDFGHHHYQPRGRYEPYRHQSPRGHYDDEPRHFKERGGYMSRGRYQPRYRDSYRDRPRSPPRYNYHPQERDTQDLPVQSAIKQLPNEPIPTTSKYQEQQAQKSQGNLPGAPPSNTVAGQFEGGQEEYEEGLIKEQLPVEHRDPRSEGLSREQSGQDRATVQSENSQRYVRRDERNPKDSNGASQAEQAKAKFSKNLDSNDRLFDETKAPQGDLHQKRFQNAGQVMDVYRGGAIGYKIRGQYNFNPRGRYIPRGGYYKRRSPGREDYYHHQDRYKQYQGGNRERSRYQMREYRQDNTVQRNEMRNSPPGYRRPRGFDNYPRYQQRDYDRE